MNYPNKEPGGDFYPHSVKPGRKAPDFTLENHDGSKVRLSKLLEQSPVLLVFYRGHW